MRRLAMAPACLIALLPLNAVGFDPDGFHECMLDHVEEGMDAAAVVAVRHACAHQNGTTASGGKPEPPISENSFVKRIKIMDPDFRFMTDRQIIESAMREVYPDESYSTVREWLTRDMEDHGPPPGLSLDRE